MKRDFYWIYLLIDPRNKEIRYVGRTRNLERRLREHLSTQSTTKMFHWISELLHDGIRPIILGVQRVSQPKANAIERQWVQSCLSNGCQLLNKKLVKDKTTSLDIYLFGGDKND